jgi:hypothetical protein
MLKMAIENNNGNWRGKHGKIGLCFVFSTYSIEYYSAVSFLEQWHGDLYVTLILRF